MATGRSVWGHPSRRRPRRLLRMRFLDGGAVAIRRSRRPSRLPMMTPAPRESPPHAGSPARRRRHQPHRRRRGGRAAGRAVKELVENAIDAGATPHRGRSPRRRPTSLILVVDDGVGMTPRRARCWRSSATAPRSCRRRSARRSHAGLPRRGAALDRRGSAAHHHHPPRGRAARPGARRSRAATSGRPAPAARGAGHAGRGARSVLRDAGAAQIHEDAPHRSARRSRDAVRRLAMAASRRRLHRWPARSARCCTWAAALPTRPGRAARGSATCSGATSRDNAMAVAPSREGVALAASPACRPQPGERARAVSLRQRPAGARQAADRRGARRL